MNWIEEVNKRKEDLLQDLMKLLKIESVKDLSTQSPGKPMGENIHLALEQMLEMAEASGFRTQNIEGYVGYAEFGDHAEKDYIGVLGHLDVVPALGTWTYPPFEPTIVDGKLYARGAIDDKGPTIAAYYGLKIVKELGFPLKHNIRLIFGTDEESGMSCIKMYRNREKMPIAGFSPDSHFPIIYAEKGQLTFRVSVQDLTSHSSSKFTLLSFHAGERVNMVPDYAKAWITGYKANLIHEFQDYCEQEGLQFAYEEVEGSYALIVYGQSAHGAAPMRGVNAGLKLAHFLQRYSFDENANRYFHLIEQYLVDDFYGTRLGIAFEDHISGPLTVNAGIFRYEEKGEKFIQINLRCPVHQEFAKTIQRLEEIATGKGYKIEGLREKKPHYVPEHSPLIQVLQRVYQEETASEPTLRAIGGATYAGFLDNGVAFGAVFPGKVMTAHQVDEYIEIEDLLKATAIYARAIYELANTDF